MNATHSQNRPLERIAKILDFIEGLYKSNPTKETFQFVAGKLSSFDPLLEDTDLLKMAFKKIATDTQENIKIEFRQGLPEQHTAVKLVTHELLVWFYVEDQNKFKEYRNSIKQEVERVGRHVQFILDADGKFYQEGETNDEKKHLIRKGSQRYSLLHFLAQQEDYVSTQEIGRAVGLTASEVRGKVDEIRDIVAKKMGLPREAIFENDGSSGYRITNVTVKKS